MSLTISWSVSASARARASRPACTSAQSSEVGRLGGNVPQGRSQLKQADNRLLDLYALAPASRQKARFRG